MSKNKNISKRYSVGTRIQTRDEFLSKNKYYKPNHPNQNDLYRGTYVVASNSNDELVLVKQTTKNGRLPKGSISEFISLFDNNGDPIKIDNVRFVANNKKNLSKQEINKICIKVFKTSTLSIRNRKLVHKFNKKRQ